MEFNTFIEVATCSAMIMYLDPSYFVPRTGSNVTVTLLMRHMNAFRTYFKA